MSFPLQRTFDFAAHASSLRQPLSMTALAIPAAAMAGSASAFFLWALDRTTQLRWDHAWLLWLLPVAGLLVGLLYHHFGREVEAGNNLIMEEIHQPGGGVPLRMAPLVLIGTLATHLCGGSAGREGTAVQMGGSLAGWFARIFHLSTENRRMLLMAGVAAGFGSVFGTPLTGAVFAMEVLVVGRIHYHAVLPVLVASIVGDYTCSAWGVHHTVYHIGFSSHDGAHRLIDATLLGKIALAALAFGLASQLFAELTHEIKNQFARFIAYPPLRPCVGGAMVIALVYALGTRDYLGIGVTNPEGGVSILSAFEAGGSTPWSWWWKLLFTALTLGAGFKGGEVTPLFFIGATFGHALAGPLGAPVDLMAGVGFIAVFAGATNTPLACTIMGIELFGAEHTVYFATACFVAYLFSGKTGIYSAQRPGSGKHPATSANAT